MLWSLYTWIKKPQYWKKPWLFFMYLMMHELHNLCNTV
jgi:hypothetical protein